MKSFRKILIANRGEIALRIIRACRGMGISPVAVYSDADRTSPHVRLADEAVPVGSAPPKESYLHIERILEAARRTAVDAIHPGYGFLAESAEFAAACEGAGIIFIGPCAETIRKIGRKSAARTLAVEAGIPVVPGYNGEDQGNEAFRRAARKLGFPVLLKASAGGGGRGMRIVSSETELENSIEAARREAEKAFGDGMLLLEKYVQGAKHVEFQILGDAQGNLVHLFERDCSLQRRHQKIIEESPSPALQEDLRKRMGAAALAIGRAIGYSNAGTVEFLLAPSGEFYFLEVNTRIQVEHPVTEMVTGVDLVRLQIEIAEGSPVPFQQDGIRPHGHAIEARLYAEDPARDFLPATGTVHVWRPPPSTASLRIEHALEEGMEIGIFYDPLLAKVICHGPDRETALRSLISALKSLALQGVETNQEFLIRVLETREFREGNTHSSFLDEHPLTGAGDRSAGFPLAAALALYVARSRQARRRVLPGVPANYRNNPYRDPSLKLRMGGQEFSPSWRHRGGNRYVVRSEELQADVEVLSCTPGNICAAIDGIARNFEVKEVRDEFFIHSSLGSRAITRLPRYPLPDPAAGRETANSPMPGQVLRILVREGQTVKTGDSLIVLEAMKMEQTITAKIDGVVEAVLVKTGQVVAPGQTLVQIHALEKADESRVN